MGHDAIRALVASVDLHAQALRDDQNLAGHTSTGSSRRKGSLPRPRASRTQTWASADALQAADRIRPMVDRQFAADGGHLEHSPDYHRMVLGTLVHLLESGLVQDPDIQSRRAVIEWALACLVTPAGKIAMFGDSSTGPSRGVDRP